MPAHQAELKEAEAEGVVVNWLRTIKQFTDGEIEVEVMKLNAKGSPEPTGQTEKIKAHMLILALGQETHSQFLANIPGMVICPDGSIEVDKHMMTGHPGIFAGGDMIPANKTVTVAVGHGKKAARNIDAWLAKREYDPANKLGIARFETLHPEWYPKSPRHEQEELESTTRKITFDETVAGLDQPAAYEESRRCLSCGNCFECDTCYDICPDSAIIKRGPARRYEINASSCSCCGLCASSCPCGAIAMVTETAK
jgi:NADPH-dependent glutamate synthase beta subunit-like oxidoreductase